MDGRELAPESDKQIEFDFTVDALICFSIMAIVYENFLIFCQELVEGVTVFLVLTAGDHSCRGYGNT